MHFTELLLRRRSAIVAPTGTGVLSDATLQVVSDAENRLQSLGYTLGGKALSICLYSSADEAQRLLDEVVLAAAGLVGAVDWNGKLAPVEPMYPNFPRQVEEASDAELYLNAIFHYLGDVIDLRIMPQYQKLDRGETARTRPLREIDVVLDRDSELRSIAFNLLRQKSTWSDLDRKDLKEILDTGVDVSFNEVFTRANLAFLIADTQNADFISSATNFTDLLRIFLALAGSSPEFITPHPKKAKNLKSVSRKFRKAIVLRMQKLIVDAGGVANALETADIKRRLPLWKIMLSHLHVGEFKKVAPDVVEFASKIRSNSLPITTRGLIQTKAVSGEALDNLRAQSPGEFARDLDWALRTSDEPVRTLEAFAKVAHLVSSRTLWSVMMAFRNREAGIRMFLPKGRSNKAIFPDVPLAPLSKDIIEQVQVVLRDALLTRYMATSPIPIGAKVWIDPVLDSFAVPFAVRNQGLATRPLGRGSKIKLNDSEYLRFFMWWRDQENERDSYVSRVDLDMSLSFLNEQYEVIEEVAFYNLRGSNAVHSGDITSAPDGAAEYIDIRRSDLSQNPNTRYVLMSVLSYTHQPFSQIPEAVAGVMLRENLDQGEIFDGKTVETAFSLIQEAVGVVPFLYDLQTQELIWLDFALNQNSFYNTAASQRGVASNIVNAVVNRENLKMSELVMAHVAARSGIIVDSPLDADFTIGADVAFQVETLLSDWL